MSKLTIPTIDNTPSNIKLANALESYLVKRIEKLEKVVYKS